MGKIKKENKRRRKEQREIRIRDQRNQKRKIN